jgi:hypothetical protein
MKYFLFMDESGDHGLININQDFPIFVLCGALISEDNYQKLQEEVNNLKHRIWNSVNVIFHSRDIRKCEKEFVKLFDLEVKKDFINSINDIINRNKFLIISSAVDKKKVIRKYGRLVSDIYELSLSFIIERSIFALDTKNRSDLMLKIILESRGKVEDKNLTEHFQKLLSVGTNYVNSSRLKSYKLEIEFKKKKENCIGLQLADLLAYPIARFILNPERVNPAYEILSQKFYKQGKRNYGLKLFP